MKPITWSVIAGALLLCVTGVAWFAIPSFSSPNFFLAETGIGYDPLTNDEANRSLAIALGVDSTTDDKAKRPKTKDPLTTDQQLEVLLVERYDAPKGSSTQQMRQGEVYLYDYATNTLIHTLVDVATGSVKTEHLQGVQLPLTAHEEERAVALIVDDTALWRTLSERYKIITGDSLRDMEQLQIKVSLFLAEAMPDQVNPAAKQCGLHRCAQVLLFTIDRTVLEILPIVDLSKGEVIQLMSDSWTKAS